MVLLGSEVDRRAEVVSVPVLEWLDISSSLSSSGGDRTRLNRSGSGMKKPKITKEENGLGRTSAGAEGTQAERADGSHRKNAWRRQLLCRRSVIRGGRCQCFPMKIPVYCSLLWKMRMPMAALTWSSCEIGCDRTVHEQNNKPVLTMVDHRAAKSRRKGAIHSFDAAAALEFVQRVCAAVEYRYAQHIFLTKRLPTKGPLGRHHTFIDQHQIYQQEP
jgi:hypothetical protein